MKQQKMAEYTEEIIQILDGEKITCGYMTVEEVVQGLFKKGETEVHCFFLTITYFNDFNAIFPNGI